MDCADITEAIVVEFGDGRSSANLMSDILINETTSRTSVCLSLQFGISSPVIHLTVAMSSSPKNLTTLTQVTARSCRSMRRCFWQETFSIGSGERLFITASKFRATRGVVAFASVADISLTPSSCLSDDTESTGEGFLSAEMSTVFALCCFEFCTYSCSVHCCYINDH